MHSGHMEDAGWMSRARLYACAVVVALLAGLFSAVPAAADGLAPAPFPPDPQYSAALTTRIATYNSSVEALVAKGNALKARIDDHERRREEHLRKLDQYPGRKAPPAIARQFNAEAAAGNAERAQLQAEAAALDAEYNRLAAERVAIAAAAQNEINARVRANPPPHAAPQPGNQHAGPVRPQSPNAAANQSAPPKQSAPPSPEKVTAVKKAVLDQDGKPLGRKDVGDVYLVPRSEIERMRKEISDQLGSPRALQVQKGTVEIWQLGGNASVSYRSWSTSRGDGEEGLTLQVNKLPDLPEIPNLKYHVEK